ncbi:GerMN domain-containing protein [Thermosipho ferrireducens]|uniref:GerMN domain-containing protein n=1 Tax=Thermosipho ferrireducens TaxID=2571116 RepID=A0ABX7S749_9BACT|nr:GerMN domain-containing protein [Thermosipho ferrireducens]QTA37610.1 GerMN domain-containing protein [Thermosipho ferrireducens]
MKKIAVIFVLVLFIYSFSFSAKIAFVNNNDIIFVEDSSESLQVEDLFKKLSKPPVGYSTYIPTDLLNAYYFVETSLIIDINFSLIQSYSLEEEIYLFLQMMYTLFQNVRGIDRIYILEDGKQTNLLVRYIDIRWSFPRDLYKK